jgi:hypothetical protein
MRHRLLAKAGVTVLDLLLALLTLILIQPILFHTMALISQIDFAWSQRQNQIGIIQLRRKIAQGVKLSVTNNTLSFDLNNKQVTIQCKDQGVYQQPGNMPYLIDLTHCEIKAQNQYVWLLWGMGEVRHELIIGIID